MTDTTAEGWTPWGGEHANASIKALQGFAKDILAYVWDGSGEIDIPDVIELATKHSLVRSELYDPAKHDASECLSEPEPGDTWLVEADILKPAPAVPDPVAAAVEAEREACALIVENQPAAAHEVGFYLAAKAIRARSLISPFKDTGEAPTIRCKSCGGSKGAWRIVCSHCGSPFRARSQGEQKP